MELPPLRTDAPGRAGFSPAAVPELDTEEARSAAVQALGVDVYAASSRRKQTTFHNTIVRALDKWGLSPMPPTRDKLVFLGAALKAGRYRTADQYLDFYKVWAEREGYALDKPLLRVYLDTVRSCRRGIGGSVQSLGIPLMRLGELDAATDSPWISGGPVGPAAAMISGAWFLTREVELSTTRARLVSTEVGADGDRVVRWHLPASKTDVEARGVSRAHGRACRPNAPGPYCAIVGQLARLRRLFPDRWDGEVPHLDLPLFPTESGEVVTKEKMTETIIRAAEMLGVPLASPDGSARVSGHSLRVAGAQGLARAGVEVWAIQLLGRWGSQTVLQYVREVPLELAASWAARAARNHALDELLRTKSAPSPQPLALPAPLPSAAPPVLGPTARAALSEALEEATRASEVSELPLTSCKYVTSDAGKWHRLACTGLAGPSAAWTSACGWRFGGSLAQLSDSMPERLCHKQVCANCFPELRERLKREP